MVSSQCVLLSSSSCLPLTSLPRPSRRSPTGGSLVCPTASFPLLPFPRLNYASDRLLMPCFGTANVYNMFDDMTDIVSQLVLKWERCVFLIIAAFLHVNDTLLL